MTEKGQAREDEHAAVKKRRELRATALLKKAPKRLPETPFFVFSDENKDKSLGFAASSEAVGAKYKEIDLTEKEVRCLWSNNLVTCIDPS